VSKKNNPSVLQLDGDIVKILTVKKNKSDISVIKALEVKTGRLSEVYQKTEKEEVSLLFPRELSVIRLLEVLNENKESIPAAVSAEIEDGLPFAKESVSWDYEILGKKNNKTNVLFAATSKDSIKVYAKDILSAGMELEGIIPTSIALYEAFMLSKSYTKEAVLILEQGKDRVDIIVIENELLIVSRGFKTNEKTPDIYENIKQTLDSVGRGNTSVKKIIVSSSCGKEAELAENIKKITEMKVEILKLPAALEKELEKAGVSVEGWNLLFGTALVALGLSKFNIDLSRNTLQKTEKMSAIRLVKRVSYWTVSFMLLLSVGLNMVNGCKRKEVDNLRTELSTLSVLSGKHWSQTVQQIFKAVPDRLFLSEFNIDNKGDIILRGNAEKRQDITVFLDNLNKIRGFSAQLGYANDIQAGNKQVVQFQMKILQKYNTVKK